MIIEQESNINSTMINKAVYNFSNQSLKIQYSSGEVYEYQGVTEDVYESFCKSESQGKFLNEQIKNKFEYSKLLNN